MFGHSSQRKQFFTLSSVLSPESLRAEFNAGGGVRVHPTPSLHVILELSQSGITLLGTLRPSSPLELESWNTETRGR